MSSVYINQSLHLKPPLQCLTALESTGTNHGFSLPKYWKKLICTWNKIACIIHNFSLFWVGKNSTVSFSIIKKYQYWVSKTWKKSTSSNRLNEIHTFNWSQVLPYKCRHPPYSSIYCLWKKSIKFTAQNITKWRHRYFLSFRLFVPITTHTQFNSLFLLNVNIYIIFYRFTNYATSKQQILHRETTTASKLGIRIHILKIQ